MEWKFNQTTNEWGLFAGNEELVKLKIIRAPANKIYKFKVKTYFSAYLVSKNKLKKLKDKNVMWIKKTVRLFKQNFETEKYLLLKKNALLKQYKKFE